MKQITCGAVAVLGMFTLAGCYSYASKDINNSNYDLVQANPVFATMNAGDSDEVIFRLVNDANLGALTSYTITGVPAGIAVNPIPNYRPQFLNDTLNPTGDKTAQAYYIRGITPGRYTFVATPTSVNTGISTTVTVLVRPITLGSALSKHTVSFGDTLVLSAPAGSVFSHASAVTFTTGAVGIVSLSADSTKLTLVAGPGITGPASVTNVGELAAPTIVKKTLVTQDSLVSNLLTTAPTTFSTTTPDIGVPITVALGSALRFTSTSQVLVGGTKAGIESISADSSTAQVVPLAGTTGAVTYTGIVLSYLPGTALSLPSGQSVTPTSVYGGPSSTHPNSIATADTIPLTGSRSYVVSNGGGIPTACSAGAVAAFGGGITCAYWIVTIGTNAKMSGDIRWTASTTDDLGLILQSADGSGCLAVLADNKGPVLGNVGDDATTPLNCGESATQTLTSGTYLLTLVSFNEGGTTIPSWFQFRISQP
ncbi:MAG TPA: hypothetical protein VGM20_15070 [Gemmatimonadales bacterium]|jgi:hypothetical protein